MTSFILHHKLNF